MRGPADAGPHEVVEARFGGGAHFRAADEQGVRVLAPEFRRR